MPDQVSPQLAYQRAKIAAGLCARCGHRPLETATHCAGCAEKHRRRMREKMRRQRGTKPWQPGKRGRPPLDAQAAAATAPAAASPALGRAGTPAASGAVLDAAKGAASEAV